MCFDVVEIVCLFVVVGFFYVLMGVIWCMDDGEWVGVIGEFRENFVLFVWEVVDWGLILVIEFLNCYEMSLFNIVE